MIDFLGHIGYIIVVLGVWQITRQKRIGWVIHGFGSLFWMGLGLLMGMSSIFLWSIVFLVLDVVGFYRWKAKQENSQ